jgi:TetR/AcrR family transcriptional repressor of acrEF/envCD operon
MISEMKSVNALALIMILCVLRWKNVFREIISPQVNVDLTLIVFHGFFSGIIKNWLMNNDSFNLYQQAPALVDSILATLPVIRVSPHDDLQLSAR